MRGINPTPKVLVLDTEDSGGAFDILGLSKAVDGIALDDNEAASLEPMAHRCQYARPR